MTANREIDYDLQFQSDIEKATALSLETLALEQFKRNKFYGGAQQTLATSATSPSSTAFRTHSLQNELNPAAAAAATTRPRPNSFTGNGAMTISTTPPPIGPPPAAPPRRNSEARASSLGPMTAPPIDLDLISFTSPTTTIGAAAAATAAAASSSVTAANVNASANAASVEPTAHASFVQMCDQMHRLNNQVQSDMGISRVYRSQSINAGVYKPTASMQIVPYAGPAAGVAQVPLTAEQLRKLYSMGPAAIVQQTAAIATQSPAPLALAATVSYNQQNIVGYQRPVNFGTVYNAPPSLSGQSQSSFVGNSGGDVGVGGIYAQGLLTHSHQQHVYAPASGFGSVNALVHVPKPKIPSKQSIPNYGRDLTPSPIASTPVFPSTLSQSNSAPAINTVAAGNSGVGVASTSAASVAGTQPNVRRRATIKKTNADDLIDLGNGGIEDNLRVSVLEAFDPLLMNTTYYGETDDKGDNVSECTNSYYSEYDPFDYLYSGGTQYSDPVYEAINKTDRTPLSPGGGNATTAMGHAPPIGWNIPSQNRLKQNDEDINLPQYYQHTPPPLPPRNVHDVTPCTAFKAKPAATYQNPATLDRRKKTRKLYENVIVRKTYDNELMEFYRMVMNVRSQYKHSDSVTNIGHIVASEIESQYPEGTSIKLLVHPICECLDQTRGSLAANSIDVANNSVALNNEKGQIEGYGPPVVFTCDISTTVDHVLMHVFCELESQLSGTVDDYALKPIGVVEWLSPRSRLNQLECIHNSIKLERDVQLGFCIRHPDIVHVIARTAQDDLRDADIKPEDILAHERVSTISYDNLMILLETLETEIDRLESSASDPSPHVVLSCSGVVQAAKAICALLGSVDTLDIANAIGALKLACAQSQTIYGYKTDTQQYSVGSKLDIMSENGDYAEVSIRPRTALEQIRFHCNEVRITIEQLLEVYAQAFRVNFSVLNEEYQFAPIPISNVSEPVMVHIMCLHRPPVTWRHDDYLLGAQIYHGTRYIGDAVVTQCSNDLQGIYPKLTFDSWLNFENIPVCTLPRESRLIFVLYGCIQEPQDGGNDGGTSKDGEPHGERRVTKVELGWSSIQLFDFESNMVQGNFLLSLWPPTTDKYLGPAPAKGTHSIGDIYPVLGIEIPNYGGRIVFPEAVRNPPPAPRLDFYSLDKNLQQELIDTAEIGYPSALDKREVLWEKRHYLQRLPHALPKILHAAHSWDFASLVDLHALLRSWHPLSPLQALELLLPRYPDMEVRAQAVRWVSAMPNDHLVCFLPQLLQALKHDTYEASPMARFLLARSLESPRIAHHLYWLLVHSLPGDSPQNTLETTNANDQFDEALITQGRYHRRNQLMLRALLATCGEKLSARFLAQNMICLSLGEVAANVKIAKESHRQKTLVHGMELVNQILLERPTSLPLGPGLEVTGVSVRNCSYFNSNTLPLKINFIGPDGGWLPAIFKSGDDLQQDMLTLQLVRMMDKLWLKEGLDLKMVTFDCVPTGHKRGMIELVTDAETLRKIQVEWGLTGSFKDKPIAEWLAKQNPSQLEYQRAVDNFTVSCAGYSVATYILGICDRHNDNIMLKTSGHLFHIDFGKFLGDAQMFGNFKRDRTPFVLTSDMAYVINGGDRPSTKFHHFVDLCCKAFNIVRKHGDLLLHMLALMATSGIPGVTADAVTYVRKALLPGQSNPEAAASFAKMIHISLKSWFTQFNFFLHNLAQLRFTADEGGGELLSFVPRTYTMAQEGRLKSVTVHGFQKRYDLEKYYTYILKVARQNQPDPVYLFRSYKEFTEFHQKLCLHYPLAKLHSLPSGIHVGRSNVKTVAERRLPEIRLFLISLFKSADEIAHSDVVYTFFHPILRDQQEADIHVPKVKEIRPANPTERVCGEIKLSLQYHRGALTVMVHHARSLPVTTSGQEPNTYVKVYLKPDPTKATKRKTKVVRKNCFPSFMETLEYRMPIDFIQSRVLQVTVWSHDSLQENEFLGGVEFRLAEMDLRDEMLRWFNLGHLPRS